MGLLLMKQNPEFQRLTNEIFNRQLSQDARLQKELDGRARQKMYQDVQYNVDLLYTAMELEDEGIFERYARWLYQLLVPLMPYCTRERVKDIMTDHYELIRSSMEAVMEEEKRPKLHRLLDCAVRVTAEEYEHGGHHEKEDGYREEGCRGDGTNEPGAKGAETNRGGAYEQEITQYLSSMLRSDMKGSMALITEYVNLGIPLSDICVDIVAEAMRRVGDLWHSHRISVDMEHYCTSITQLSLSQLYPLIFNQQRKGKKVLVACIGSELHEIGARMVADMFEYNGWDSIYLGAAVPVESVENAIMEHQPVLAALSVTMPQHLPLCRAAVEQLRKTCPQVRIAVGGLAFEHTDIWKNWGVDIYTKDDKELVTWADETI